jgi:hypothetical protein
LPGFNERVRLLHVYIKKLLLDEKYCTQSLIKSTKKLLTKNKINEIAISIKGFSGGEIESLINGLATNAALEKTTQLTEKNIGNTVKQAVNKYLEFTQGKYLNLVHD